MYMNEKDGMTKRELLVEAISDLVKIQVKLENEIKKYGDCEENYNTDNLTYKLDSIKESIKTLVHTLDIYFTY